MKQQSSSIVTLALLLVAGGTTIRASAQTAADKFPLPTSVAAGTKVQIDGSSSLQAVNQGLKDRFQKQFPGTDVTVPTQYQGSDSGVKAIAEDKADLAGIGRLLTKEEKAQGLVTKTIGRSKIAIIVKDNNPYKGNLTLKDFAKIYRGEITDWSQLPSAKGATGKIKVIDRPDVSDTRRAFANYPVFQNGKLKTGSNAEKLTEDSTQSVVDKLGDDGIGYAPADQIKGIPGIRAVTLHSTQPDNPKYPFSQPLAYAYKNKDGKVSDGTKAFLGYVGDAAGTKALQEFGVTGVVAGAAAAPDPTAAASPAATTPDAATTPPTDGAATTSGTTGQAPIVANGKGSLPWWLLLVPLVGGLLLWAFGRKKPTETPYVAPVPETPASIKPLYPPQPPNRTPRGDGLSGDLSGDLTSATGGYRPSSDLRSGDLRSGDLSALPSPPIVTPPNIPNVPNINFNGVVDTVKDKADGIGLAGGAAIAGGAAAAAALGKGMFDAATGGEKSADSNLPELKAPNIDLSNPLEGLKDKSSNLIPDLGFNNPLDGIKEKVGDTIQGGGAAAATLGGAAVAGGAAFAGGVGNLFGNDHPESSDLSLEVPDFNPVADVKAKTADLIPDLSLEQPQAGILDKAGDFLKDGGGTAVAGGAAALAGGAALFGGAGKSVTDLFGGNTAEAPEELVLEETGDLGNDPFNFGNPLDAIKDQAGNLKDQAAELIPGGDSDPFDFSNPLDAVKDKAGDLQAKAGELLPDLDGDPFDFSNPLDAVKDKAGDLQAKAGELLPDVDGDPFDFGNLTGKAGDFLKGGGAAAVAAGGAAVAGGAALFGGQKPEIDDLSLANPETDTFDRDLEAISLDGFDEDPFAGLSDLLGEETGDISNDIPKPEASDFLSSLKDKAADFIADGKDLGGAALAGGAAATVGAGQAVQSFFKGKDAPASNRDDVAGTLYSEGQITLVSPSATQAYAHWEIPVRLKRQLREQGGQKLVVRLYDVTSGGSNLDLPATFQEFECNDSDWDLEIPISQSEHRYLTEIGYVTGDGRWLMLARSAPLWIREQNS
jgi:ABC-type phosphate transport system substrate-binding protein